MTATDARAGGLPEVSISEDGPVRHPLTEIFRDVLTATSHQGTTDTNKTKEAHR